MIDWGDGQFIYHDGRTFALARFVGDVNDEWWWHIYHPGFIVRQQEYNLTDLAKTALMMLE